MSVLELKYQYYDDNNDISTNITYKYIDKKIKSIKLSCDNIPYIIQNSKDMKFFTLKRITNSCTRICSFLYSDKIELINIKYSIRYKYSLILNYRYSFSFKYDDYGTIIETIFNMSEYNSKNAFIRENRLTGVVFYKFNYDCLWDDKKNREYTKQTEIKVPKIMTKNEQKKFNEKFSDHIQNYMNCIIIKINKNILSHIMSIDNNKLRFI